MRVLHLLLASDAGGLSQYVLALADGLARRGHEVHVLGDVGAWQDRFDASPSLTYHRAPLTRGLCGFATSVRAVRRLQRELKFDVLHAHYRRAVALGRWAQRRKRPPLVYTLHLSHLRVAGWRRWLVDWGDLTHVASADAERWLVEEAGGDPARVALLPHGIDLTRFPERSAIDHAALGLPDDAPVGVYVGRLDEDHPKNVPWLVDLAACVPNLHLLLVGDGPHRALVEARARALNVTSRVHLLGETDPRPALRAADLFLLPSGREGFSYATAEALATGVPVLRTRTSGTAETVVEGVTGRSVPVEREAFLAAAADMLADRAALARMGASAAAHARRHFDVEKQIDGTVALYERAIACA